MKRRCNVSTLTPIEVKLHRQVLDEATAALQAAGCEVVDTSFETLLVGRPQLAKLQVSNSLAAKVLRASYDLTILKGQWGYRLDAKTECNREGKEYIRVVVEMDLVTGKQLGDADAFLIAWRQEDEILSPIYVCEAGSFPVKEVWLWDHHPQYEDYEFRARSLGRGINIVSPPKGGYGNNYDPKAIAFRRDIEKKPTLPMWIEARVPR